MNFMSIVDRCLTDRFCTELTGIKQETTKQLLEFVRDVRDVPKS
jgi:hypothetical protein